MAENLSSNSVVKSGVFTARFLSVSVVTVVLFSILVKLGFWQLGRAEEKRSIETRVESLNQREPKLLSELTSLELDEPTGMLVRFRAEMVKEKYLLLDNQNHQGEVGYLALQLARSENGLWVLVERGFVTAPNLRSKLPKVDWLEGVLEGKGRLYRKSVNPLSQELYMESEVPSRIQNLNFEQLEEQWQVDLEPYVIQPQFEQWLYPQPWQPISLSPEKHTGYAVQWFSMAGALLLLCGVVLFREIQSCRKQH